MFRLYKEEFCPRNSIQGASYDKYRQVFNNCNPPLAFYCPKKDQCTKCNIYKDLLDKSSHEEEHALHKRRELEALQSKEADKKIAKTDKGFRAITFDMQSILSIPHAGDAQIFYKRKLNVYNITIFEGHNSDAHCFLWDETNGGKGSFEVSTCLLKYLSSLPDTVKHVSSFSDTCGGQNRNKYVATAMLYAVNNFAVEKIDLKFMEPGHSYLETDSIHSTIERAKMHKKIYSVNEWRLLMELARRNPGPYMTNAMHHNNFYNVKELYKNNIFNVNIDITWEPVQWLKIKWLQFQKSDPNLIFYKNDLWDEDFKINNVLSNRRSGRSRSWNNPVPRKYDSRIPLCAAKKKALLDLLAQGVILTDYSDYIKNLPYN